MTDSIVYLLGGVLKETARIVTVTVSTLGRDLWFCDGVCSVGLGPFCILVVVLLLYTLELSPIQNLVNVNLYYSKLCEYR